MSGLDNAIKLRDAARAKAKELVNRIAKARAEEWYEERERFENLHVYGLAVDLIVDGKIKHVELSKFLAPAPVKRGPDNGSTERMQTYDEPG